MGLIISHANCRTSQSGNVLFLFAAASLTALPLVARPPILDAPATNALQVVAEQYAPVSNVTCTVRREVGDGKGGKLEVMSRVVWARGDRMNVQVVKPSPRRIVIDGETVRIKGPNDESPAIYQVTNQTATQFANLRSVPGGPEELLAPLATLLAVDRPPRPPFARTISFSDPQKPSEEIATVSFDEFGRVARLDFAAADGAAAGRSSVTFRAPFEALPGVWLFRRTETEATVGGRTLRMVSRFDKFEVNGDLPAAIFDPKSFF